MMETTDDFIPLLVCGYLGEGEASRLPPPTPPYGRITYTAVRQIKLSHIV